MIPKIIHYCWFGGNEKPESVLRCIESWKKYCPDYEIKEWNEDNFDININNYVKEAYQNSFWAFVSDYARFFVLYKYGGLYFDTDVELIKPIDDLVEEGPFFAREHKDKLIIATGLGMCALPGMNLYKEVLGYYDTMHFVYEDGTFNKKTVVDHVTKVLVKNPNEYKYMDTVFKIQDISIYPKEFFCPIDYLTGDEEYTENTRAIHHYDSTWLSEGEKEINQKVRKVNKRFGHKISLVYKILLETDSIYKEDGLKASFHHIKIRMRNWSKNM